LKKTTKLFIVFLMIVSSYIGAYSSDSESIRHINNIAKGVFAVLVAMMVWDAFRKTNNDKE
jgi:putative Mn2+ efflux pump MntP